MEGNAAQLDAPRVVPEVQRRHAITLCCAQSVQGMVEEVARNLEGLGFRTQVVCGAEARAALLGRPLETRAPMIYVVCVQGTLKETVLKPLRQALATHGGPNQHLFVAVLDLSLPLAMVGQIRRFAEALERTAPAGAANRDGLGERREWRASFGPQRVDPLQTRNYRALKLVEEEKLGTRPRRQRRTITASRRQPRKVAPTQRYKAVTASLPQLTEAPAPSEPRRARHRSPPTRARRGGVAPDVQTRTIPEPRADARPFAATVAPRRRRGGVVMVAVGIFGVAGAGLFATGTLDGWIERSAPKSEQASAEGVTTTPDHAAPVKDAEAENGSEKADQTAQPHTPGEAPGEAPTRKDSEAQPGGEAVPASGDGPVPEQDQGTGEEPDIEEIAPDGDVDEIREDEPERGMDPTSSDAAAILDAAAERYRIRIIGDMWVTQRQKGTTTWSGAIAACKAFELDGVAKWRIPYRRELKLIGAVGALPPGTYWSRSESDVDQDFVYVYESAEHRLVEWLKQEPTGAIVCVKDRK